MTIPTVSNLAFDKEKNIEYDVVAFRKLTEAELIQAVRTGISLMKKKPKKNSRYKFITVIGHRD
jgi:hypothetical protein